MNDGNCPKCGGSGGGPDPANRCHWCHGTGRCPTCKGLGTVYPDHPEDGGPTACPYCTVDDD